MKKILAVDDSELDRELLIEMLKEYKVKNEFLQAKDGEEAIEVLGKNFQDIALILLDWQMPKMSGIEFLEGIARVPAVASIPVVMVTISGSPVAQQEARQTNPNLHDYVVKPYTPRRLLEAVKDFATT